MDGNATVYEPLHRPNHASSQTINFYKREFIGRLWIGWVDGRSDVHSCLISVDWRLTDGSYEACSHIDLFIDLCID